ncbi:MAG: hypothetical protein ACMUIL_09035 [bacterium]
MFKRNIFRISLDSVSKKCSIYVCIILGVLIILLVGLAYGQMETCRDVAIKIKDLKANECATITKSSRSGFYRIIVEKGLVPLYPFEIVDIDSIAEFVESCLGDYQSVLVMRDGSTNYFLVFYPEATIVPGAGNESGAWPPIPVDGRYYLPGVSDPYKYVSEYIGNLFDPASLFFGYGLLGGLYGGLYSGYGGYANPLASPFNYPGVFRGSPVYSNSGLFSPLSLGSQLSPGYFNAISGNFLNYMMAANTSLINPATAISGYETILREPDYVRNAHSTGFIPQRLF